MRNEGMSATFVSQHFGCTRRTKERLQRQFCVTGNVADHPQSGRPRVTTAADDLYIVLQHLRYRRLIAVATRRQYLYASTGCQKSVETKHSTYSCVPTVLRSITHPTSSNGKAGLVLPSPALPTCRLGFDFVFR